MKMLRSLSIFFASIAVLLFMLVSCDRAHSTTGSIEETYAADGPNATTWISSDGFTIFYPTKLVGNHPIITFGNGTAAPTFVYLSLLKHLASWGFVVIDSNDVSTHSGEELIDGIDYLIDQNETEGSIFYGKLDTNHIGTSGHSQGGGGAINAATDSRVTCSVPIATSSGDIGQVDGPVFLVVGEDDLLITADLVRKTNYSQANGPTVFGVVGGMNHRDFSVDGGAARGYITAWFMYYLQEDGDAGEAFTGSCEICSNSNWTVETKNYP